MIINCCLFVKRFFPNPVSAKDFPCYKQEQEKARAMPILVNAFKRTTYDKYVSTIICIMEGDKYESFEIAHKIEAVESTGIQDIGRETGQVLDMLISRMKERMRALGLDITGETINYKFYGRHSYMPQEVSMAIRAIDDEYAHGRLIKKLDLH